MPADTCNLKMMSILSINEATIHSNNDEHTYQIDVRYNVACDSTRISNKLIKTTLLYLIKTHSEMI